MKHITLSTLNRLVSEALSAELEETYWIIAEISEMRIAANGHCYMELIEKDETTGKLQAKASAHIWKFALKLIKSDFEKQTGQRLSTGLKILIAVEPTFHELYGYSLNIIDIDPTYTLGDISRHRQEIIRQLEADGVLTLNKELPLKRPTLRIAVVSSSTAAGYEDFIHQLKNTSFRFVTKLFPAVMQGEDIEDSIIAALDDIAAQASAWDCVCILRGGGAVSDLQGFESYKLAANVAQFPLPVLTGIGHERDETVLDIVAHTHLKTPTATAAFLIDQAQAEIETIKDLEAYIYNNIAKTISQRQAEFEKLSYRVSAYSSQFCNRASNTLSQIYERIKLKGRNRIAKEHTRNEILADSIPRLVKFALERSRNLITLTEQKIKMTSPERILSLGYSITSHNGHLLTDIAKLNEGDMIETHVANGKIISRIEQTTKTDS